ncbi:isoleucine--tRNA ligase [Candidatus Sulfidibacterium hydrothermale]|uniref:isoleucine--tRNA ligase n=1 Tax=Candidatus Sulfidibacterium hydrothermale TaxID=2875962 RepID=UPI001F0A1479|nr:isoleucine--tRNA ligase [Candidatus Sulfidibacterium hydrothermale]UBM62282.1 isoleucine--tRNA ligase [Candidatus Sulfidibacterium hydrothermale]
MGKKYQEYKQLNLTQIGDEVRKFWEKDKIFEKSLKNREGNTPFVFYEGPPSANGKPGIHHVMARTIKDLFCRYQTQKGKYVERKAGWDTHGLPVEISVEKTLGITKEDIGKKISVEEYNNACRKEVLKYKDMWDDLTKKIGYWVDLEHPYITFDNKYIETVWYLLKQLYDKGLLYKGYTIQPYSPAAGTGLSTHELNQPGCYRDVSDTTAVAQFKVIRDDRSEFLFEDTDTDVYFLAWTTTPWTLPSNTALAVGPDIRYLKVKTFNPYTGIPETVILAEDRLDAYFKPKDKDLAFEDYKPGDKHIPYKVIGQYSGKQLTGIRYEQLFPWVKPMGKAFEVITGDFVTTEDGTGIVHIAPTFGADDDRVAKEAGIAPLILIDKNGEKRPMVDLKGRFYTLDMLDEDFVKEYVNADLYNEYAGRYVKNAYDETLSDKDGSLDIDLAVSLKKENKVFRIEKHVHNYPHCWRTDKPVLYYPLDSWFVKTTALKDRMIALNKTINWKPKATGEGRFGNWLENLVDWNLSRSRFWGVPLPVWTTEDRTEQKCLGSAAELKAEVEKAVAAGVMKENPLKDFNPDDMSDENYRTFDFHRPYVDNIVLVSDSGKKMYREPSLIDVWFDSGSMPYAQLHYPFENKETFKNNFPADFIAEGVDQTRGWFFTLHAIATMLFDSVAYKTVVSNGLVLDKNGNKMSKRLGNAVDPFETIEKYSSDATRWYMITNSQPWDNLRFDLNGVDEVRRKFFGTLHNTYAFFALYANIDGFTYSEEEIPVEKRTELDRWILSELNSLIKTVDEAYGNYEPTRAGRAIQYFVNEHLSNWYVRLSRRRFWKGSYSEDKIQAYQTLYRCLEVVAQLMAPVAPFYADRLFKDLNDVTGRIKAESVHLTDFPEADESQIDKLLEERMEIAQKISSMILSLRKKTNIRVRQPLNKVLIPVLDKHFQEQVQAVENLILSETNIKHIEYITGDSEVLVKKIKPNFKTLGPKYGKMMKQLAGAIMQLGQPDIRKLENGETLQLEINGQPVEITREDVEISTQDIPGWSVASLDNLTVALDITITDDLKKEGLARELVNRVQNLRKEKGLEVTDRITLQIEKSETTDEAFESFKDYICTETLADLTFVENSQNNGFEEVELTDGITAKINIEKK